MHFFDLEDTKALEVLQQLCRVAERVPVGAASFDWHIRCPVLLATAHANLEQRVEAERTLQPPLRLLNSADGVPLHLALWARRAIAKVQMKLGHQEESERMMRAARAMDLERPHKHRAEANSISLRLDLAEVLEHGGKTQEACQVLEQLVPDARRVFGPKHGVTCDVYMQLCTAYQSLRLPAKTEDLLQGAEILDMDLELCDDKDVLLLAHKRAAALLCRGKYAEALRWLHPLAHAFERVFGTSSEDALAMQSDLAFALRELGRLGESEALYRRLQDAERELYGARHATTLCTQGMLGFVLMRAGRFTVRVRPCVCVCVCVCVRVCVCTCVRGTRRLSPRPVLRTVCARVYAVATGNLTCCCTPCGRFAEAEAVLTRVREVQAEGGGAHDPALFVTTANLAHCMHEQVRAAAFACGLVQMHLFVASEMLTSEVQARTPEAVSLLCALHQQLVDTLGDGHASARDVRAQLADYGHPLGAQC
jgi:tetratricopeptide (TPR) repeat protein